MAKNHEAEESDPSSNSGFELEEEDSASENLPSPTNTNFINSNSLFATESNPGFAQKPESIPTSSLGLKTTADKKGTEPLHVKVNKGGSRNLIERVFSEEDEICVLKAMLEFIKKTKCDPVPNIDEFIEKLPNLGVTRGQLYTKIKRMKGKFRNNAAKERRGHGLKFGNKHKREVYKLSKKIWGINTEAKSDGNGKGGEGGSFISTACEQWIMDQELETVDRKKKRKLEKKLKEIQVLEIQLFAMKCKYLAEKARVICAAKKSTL